MCVGVFTLSKIDQVEDQVTALTMDAPLVTRSVKTRTAARVMIQRYREAVELLADNVRLLRTRVLRLCAFGACAIAFRCILGAKKCH